VALGGHEDDVGIGGIDHDPRDLADVAEAHELPALARIGRHEDPAAIHHVVARVPFPVPTHTTFGLEGASATAPIDDVG